MENYHFSEIVLKTKKLVHMKILKLNFESSIDYFCPFPSIAGYNNDDNRWERGIMPRNHVAFIFATKGNYFI